MENYAVYDVVIVGSGIAGAIIAKNLTNAGKSVLILEAGLEAGIAMDKEKSYENYQKYLDQFYLAQAKVPNSPYPNIKDAPSPTVLDIKNVKEKPSDNGYFVQNGPVAFGSDYNRSPGGTTLHWLGTCLRMLPNDFEMQKQYKRGVDWPFKYEYLKPYYEMAEHEIGVSAEVSEQVLPNMGDDFFGKEYVFPMHKIPQSYLDQVISKGLKDFSVKVNDDDYKIWTTSTPQGRNSDPNVKYRNAAVVWDAKQNRLEFSKLKNGLTYNPVGAVWDDNIGKRCEGNASCVPICPVMAKYNALKTIKSANPKNLTILTQAAVSKVEFDSTNGKVTAIRYKHYKGPGSNQFEEKTVSGRLYVLAASAIENAKLLLASGVPNTSKMIGANLMDHLVMRTWGLTQDEKIYPYRGPGSTTNIPSFRDGNFRKDFSAWISPFDNWGWAWPAFSPGSDISNGLAAGMYGKELKDYLANRVPRQFFLHFELEQLPSTNNRVTIDPKYRDNLGNFRPVINYEVDTYNQHAAYNAKSVSDQIFKHLNIKDFTNYDPTDPDYVEYDFDKGNGFVFGGAGHTVGTHCMGTAANNSVVDKDQRCWDHQNMFLAGAGNMATLGTSNPTLTVAALSFAVADNILKELSKKIQ